MASEVEKEGNNNSAASLPLFTLPALRNLKHSGKLCSPLHTLASVPFRWEEQPGKPRPSNALALPSAMTTIPKCLDLPPRLLYNDANKLTTNTPSPTTVLEGPYNTVVGRSISFSFLRKGQVSSDRAPEGGSFLVRGNKKDHKGLLGSRKKKTGAGSSLKRSTTDEIHGSNFVFPSTFDDATGSSNHGETMTVATVGGKRGVSGLSQAKSHFWATIFGTFKQAIPRKSSKCKKEAM